MSKTILIIDDFASVRLYHMSFLTRKGYRCIGAGDGADALAKLRENHVDLVLLDLVMPGMDGAAFMAALAANPALASLPVLAITSEEPLAQAVFGGSSRPMSILTKPVMPGALLRRVQQLLPLSETAPVPVPGV